MAIEGWLPLGFHLPAGLRSGRPRYEGDAWQIVDGADGSLLLLVKAALHERWNLSKLVEYDDFHRFEFGGSDLLVLESRKDRLLSHVGRSRSPNSKSEALAFAEALRLTRSFDAQTPLQDAIYVQKLARLLPTYTLSPRVSDDHVLGAWLTGGARISAGSTRRLSQMLSWLGESNLDEVIAVSGVAKAMPAPDGQTAQAEDAAVAPATEDLEERGVLSNVPFALPGREELESFFNEHVIDIMKNKERYAALGVPFPGAIALHGPPGCGKTFAVEQLVDYLGWPSFQIDASSVASPYIHETSRKVAEIFNKAMSHAPSVLVIDEMEAFLTDRPAGGGAGTHRVEEVAEFLRRIPEASSNEVLVIGMTNKIEMIDPAIMRRGRFDHVIQVDPASEGEIRALLKKLLAKLPGKTAVDTSAIAHSLAGRPLSDVAYAVREGARLSARAGLDHVDPKFISAAVASAPSRSEPTSRRIGF